MVSKTQIPLYRRPLRPAQAIISSLVALALLLTFHLNHAPANLIAQDAPPATIEAILTRGEDALSRHNWRTAQDAFNQAIDACPPSQRSDILTRLQWCRAQEAIESRHRDGSLARYIKATDTYRAQSQLAQTIQLIQQHYHQPLDKKQWCLDALLQLQGAAQSDLLVEQFRLKKTPP